MATPVRVGQLTEESRPMPPQFTEQDYIFVVGQKQMEIERLNNVVLAQAAEIRRLQALMPLQPSDEDSPPEAKAEASKE